MSSVDHSLTQAGIAPERALGEFISASPSIGKSGLPRASSTLLALMAVISAILVPSRMLLSSGPPDDSSVFSYIGWAMRHGLMPYRDVWDHKGPLLYYLQFAGVSLHPASTFGIGLLELIAFSFAFFLLYRVIASFASYRVSLGIAILSLVFVTYFSEGGNLCESWALLPIAAAHYAIWRWSQRMSLKWCASVLGICFASIFWLRPNIAVYPLLATLVMLYASNGRNGLSTAVRQFAFAGTAAVALTLLILAPLYYFGVFHEFVAAYFKYNAAYSGALSLPMRLLHTQQLLMHLFAAGIAILGTAGWTLALKERRQENTVIRGIPPLYVRTLIWSLPLEIAAASLSGRDYAHYVLPMGPTFAILAAWFLSELEGLAKEKENAGRRALALALLLGLFPFALASYAGEFSRSLESPSSEHVQVARFIQHATGSNDKIIVIGGVEAGYITYLSQRLPASRYVYQYSLIDAANPVAADQRRQFLCELVSNRPAVIVSTNALLGPLCASTADCNKPSGHAPLSDYGYNSALLPQLLKTFIASQYRAFDDPRFGTIHLFIRKDVVVPSQW
jgi:hypothetical protein